LLVFTALLVLASGRALSIFRDYGNFAPRMFRRLFHAYPFDPENRTHWHPRRSVVVARTGGESKKDDWRLCATEWTLRIRLQSSELVHRLHLHQRPIDPGAVLAVL
jgi:hypothetical protein